MNDNIGESLNRMNELIDELKRSTLELDVEILELRATIDKFLNDDKGDEDA